MTSVETFRKESAWARSRWGLVATDLHCDSLFGSAEERKPEREATERHGGFGCRPQDRDTVHDGRLQVGIGLE